MSTQTSITPAEHQSTDEILAEIAALRAENARLSASKVQNLTLRVSAKGAVSVYGMGRWPVTLYAEQWTRLLAQSKAIEAFIQANRKSLSTKADKAESEDKPEGF